MSEKNLPIKLVMQKETDNVNNKGGGEVKFFGAFTSDLKQSIINKFEYLEAFYQDIFQESELVPAVGKIIVKPEAIAKSHKPNDLCRNCPIIGSEDLNEIYIKLKSKSIKDTINLIKNPPSERFRANMTAVLDIRPITVEEKISKSIEEVLSQNNFASIKQKIKVKIFDFDNEFDNEQLINYVFKKLITLGFANRYELIAYGKNVKFIKIQVDSYDDIIKIAEIHGVKAVDFFQEYSLPDSDFVNTDLKTILQQEYTDSEISIGIIDGGISDDNEFLKPYILAREEYVNKIYQNPKHATFIASMIQYGDILNNITVPTYTRFRFVDIIAIPNSDNDYGPVDSINEDELMEIIEETMQKYAHTTKIWNLSLGIPSKICDGGMSDLGIFLDYIQDQYQVQIFVSSGNLNGRPLREWPPQITMGERDRIISPADSVRSITVGALALYDSEDSIVKHNEPSPFSRRGPGANYTVKPEVVDYGGNLSKSFCIDGLGMKGLDPNGKIIEGNGTSYSTPRVAQKFATIYDEMVEKDILLAKAMLIHSARMNSRELLEDNQDNIKYYGFGLPTANIKEILHCSEDEVTLVFKQKVTQGSHLELYDFPYPQSLIRNGKCYGEICMTLAYNPILDERYGREYCRANMDVHFGVYKANINGEIEFKGCVPLEKAWDQKFEKAQVENGFKWSPIKSYYRKISKGIDSGLGWKIRIDMNARNEISIPSQEFVLIITIKDPGGNDIYSEVVNGLKERGYITNNLETRQQVRQRQ